MGQHKLPPELRGKAPERKPSEYARLLRTPLPPNVCFVDHDGRKLEADEKGNVRRAEK